MNDKRHLPSLLLVLAAGKVGGLLLVVAGDVEAGLLVEEINTYERQSVICQGP